MAEPAVRRTSSGAADQSIGDLVSVAARDISQLVRYELDLAKLELKADAKRLGIGGGTGRIASVHGLPGADAALLRPCLRPQRPRHARRTLGFLPRHRLCLRAGDRHRGFHRLAAGEEGGRHEQDPAEPGRRRFLLRRGKSKPAAPKAKATVRAG